ncbi:hypothetical protein IWW55_003093, partial [Coemansia sp. RSA 2706]
RPAKLLSAELEACHSPGVANRGLIREYHPGRSHILQSRLSVDSPRRFWQERRRRGDLMARVHKEPGAGAAGIADRGAGIAAVRPYAQQGFQQFAGEPEGLFAQAQGHRNSRLL